MILILLSINLFCHLLYISLELYRCIFAWVLLWTHSSPLTEHKSVLSLAALCSASVIMHGWCCYSGVQGPSDMPRPVCFMPHAV